MSIKLTSGNVSFIKVFSGAKDVKRDKEIEAECDPLYHNVGELDMDNDF